MMSGGLGLALAQRPAATIPRWTTELRELTPNVYAYTQASGPGVDNASLSNAGVIAGPDHLLAIDALGPPVHAKAFRAARFAAWTNPERSAWNAVRLYAAFDGTLTPATDTAAQNRAVAEYNRLTQAPR